MKPALALVVAALFALGVGSVELASAKRVGGVKRGTCVPGKPCACDGAGACNLTCAGAGCAFVCKATGACTLGCPKGRCTAVMSGAGAAVLNCAGNGCRVTCEGSGVCALRQCKKDCTIECKGAGICQNDCKDRSCKGGGGGPGGRDGD